MKNTEFFDILRVCGKLDGVKDFVIHDLEKSEINIKEIYDSINEIFVLNDVSDERNNAIFWQIILEVVKISNYHSYNGNFLDTFNNIIKLYKLKYDKNYSYKGMALLEGFISFNEKMPYRLDNLKEYRRMIISYNKTWYNHAIGIKYKENDIYNLVVDKEECLAYMIKDGKETKIKYKNNYTQMDVINLILDLDYDLIFVPSFQRSCKEKLIKDYLNSNINNEQFFTVLRILDIGRSGKIPLRLMKYMDRLLLSNRDLKNIIYNLSVMKEDEKFESVLKTIDLKIKD